MNSDENLKTLAKFMHGNDFELDLTDLDDLYMDVDDKFVDNQNTLERLCELIEFVRLEMKRQFLK